MMQIIPPCGNVPAQTHPIAKEPLPLPAVAYKVLADVLGGSSKSVLYRPYFAPVFGGACNALLLSQFWFWTNTDTVVAREGGWFWKSQKDISRETGLTRTETQTARRKLCRLGVLIEEVRGCPATVHFRINKDVLFARLWAHIQAHSDEFAENLQTGLQDTCKLTRGKPANKAARNLQALHTENKQEKEYIKHQTRAHAPAPKAMRSLLKEAAQDTQAAQTNARPPASPSSKQPKAAGEASGFGEGPGFGEAPGFALPPGNPAIAGRAVLAVANTPFAREYRRRHKMPEPPKTETDAET